MEARTENITRYILPLREGGSLPGLVEAGDGFRYVAKLRGAGHGVKALIAEFIGGNIAKAAGFNVPEHILLNLPEEIAITESDIEVQELLQGSKGLNLGIHFLKGAYNLDPYVNKVDTTDASRIVWLDAYLMNVDRTFRNPNILDWNNETWLIDHGASLYFHHNWDLRDRAAENPFPYIKDHIFLHKANEIKQAEKYMLTRITPEVIDEIVSMVPYDWLNWDDESMSQGEIMKEYADILKKRLDASEIFTAKAIQLHENL